MAERAAGIPFDNGVFDISVRPSDEKLGEPFSIDQVSWPDGWLTADPELPRKLMAERDLTIEVWRKTRLPEQALTRENHP